MMQKAHLQRYRCDDKSMIEKVLNHISSLPIRNDFLLHSNVALFIVMQTGS